MVEFDFEINRSDAQSVGGFTDDQGALIEAMRLNLLDMERGIIDHFVFRVANAAAKERYKLIIFTADNCLTKTRSGDMFRRTADDWVMLPGRAEKCKALRAEGKLLGIASNQGGVAFPWSRFGPEDIRFELAALNMLIDGVYLGICFSVPNEKALPDFYNKDDPRRLPNPEMLKEAMRQAHVEPADTLFVGVRPEDEMAARAAGCSFEFAEHFFHEDNGF